MKNLLIYLHWLAELCHSKKRILWDPSWKISATICHCI